jgi:hypothetical protein
MVRWPVRTTRSAFQNDPLDQEYGYFAIYRKNDFADSRRQGRISDGVMVLVAGSVPLHAVDAEWTQRINDRIDDDRRSTVRPLPSRSVSLATRGSASRAYKSSLQDQSDRRERHRRIRHHLPARSRNSAACRASVFATNRWVPRPGLCAVPKLVLA